MAIVANVSIGVGADTSQAEKDIQGMIKRIERLSSSGALISKSYTQPLGRISGSVTEFEKSLEAANARVVAFGASAGSIFLVQKALQGIVKATIDVEKSLLDINVILGLSSSALAGFGDRLFDVASKTGQAFDVAAKAAVEFSRQGLGMEETLKRTKDALILTRLSGLDVAASTQTITAALNTFNKTALESTELINKLANVDAAFAVSSGDLAEAIRRVGSSASDAGVGLDELIALVTSTQQTTARGGAVIGNSLKTIFTRVQRPEVLQDLELFGVAVRSASGEVLPAVQVLKNFAKAYDTLAPAQKSVTSELLGGVYQINILKAAVGDLGRQYSVYDRALAISSGSTNEAILRNDELNKSFSALFNEASNNATRFGAAFGKGAFEPALRGVLEFSNSLFEKINEKDPEDVGSKIGKGVVDGIGKFLGTSGLAILGFVGAKLLSSFGKFASESMGSFSGLNVEAKRQQEIQQLTQNILIKNPDYIRIATSSAQGRLAVEQEILKAVKETAFISANAKSLGIQMAPSIAAKSATKSKGFIPNYAQGASEELIGAISGGYMPGKVVKSPVGGVMNTAEEVKRVPGFSQPFINPPENSEAGRAHKIKSLGETGINPYASRGFIPNFAEAEGLTFRKSFEEFGITRVSGFSGKSHVGDIEHSKSGKTTEIEAFDIKEEFRGKGHAKEFYKQLPDGRVKGTLLPNYDENGNVYFPQLGRARSRKNPEITQYDFMENTKKLSLQEFESLIAKNRANKAYWKDNSFDLMTSAAGFIPGSVDITRMVKEFPALENREKADSIDSFNARINPIYQKKTISQYNEDTTRILKEILPTFGKSTGKKIEPVKLEKFKDDYAKAGLPQDRLDSFVKEVSDAKPGQGFMSMHNKLKGILGEADGAALTGRSLNKSGEYFDLAGGVEVKTRKEISASSILRKGMNEYLARNNIKNNPPKDDKVKLDGISVVIPKGGAISGSRGFIPNFAPVTGGQFDDFDETIVHYPLGTDPKELFGPESVKKASLTTYGKSLVGSKTPINVVTARESNSRQAIQDFLVKSNIPVNKVVTTGSMFRKTNLDSSGKKAEYIKKTFSKYGQPINLTDDSERNIAALQSLNNPSITGTLYKEAGQQGLGQELSKAPIPVLNKVFQLRQTANEKQAIKNVQNNPGRGSAGEVRDWEISHELGRLYEEQLKMGGLAQAGFTNINHLSGKGAAAPFGSNFPADFYARSGATPWFLDAKSTSANESKQSRLGPKATTMQNAWDSIKGNKSHVEALEKGLWEKISKGQESINFGVVASEVPGPTARGYKRPDSIVKGFKNLNRDRDGALETYGNFSGGFVPNLAERNITGQGRFDRLATFLTQKGDKPEDHPLSFQTGIAKRLYGNGMTENDFTDFHKYLESRSMSGLRADITGGYFAGAAPPKLSGFSQQLKDRFKRIKEAGNYPEEYDIFKGAAEGFIPNFAPSTLGVVAKSLGAGAIKALVERMLGDGAVDAIEASQLTKLRPEDVQIAWKLFTSQKTRGDRRREIFEKALREHSALRETFPSASIPPRASGGFVPNFANSLSEAMGREEAAGYSSSQVKVGFDKRLKSSGGLGVYNSSEGSLGNAINIHRSSGKSMKDLQNQGAAKGFVPNFAADGLDIASITLLIAGMGGMATQLRSTFQILKGTLTDEQKERQKVLAALITSTRNENKAKVEQLKAYRAQAHQLGGATAEVQAKISELAQAIRSGGNSLSAARQESNNLNAPPPGFMGENGRLMNSLKTGAALQASFAIQQVGSIAGQFINEDSQGGKMAAGAVEGVTGAASTAATFAQLGSALGPWGAAAGAALGAIVGGMPGLQKMIDSGFAQKVEEMGLEAEIAGKKIAAISSGVQAYVASLEGITAVFENENAKPEDLTRARKMMDESMLKIPAEFRDRMMQAGLEATKIRDVFNDITENLEKKKIANEQGAKVMGQIQENRSRFLPGSQEEVFTDKGMFSPSAFKAKQARQSFKNLYTDTIDSQAVSKASKEGTLDETLPNMEGIKGRADLYNRLKSSGLYSEEALTPVEFMPDSEESLAPAIKVFKEIFENIREGVSLNESSARQLEISAAAAKAFNDRIKNLKQELDSARVLLTSAFDVAKIKAFESQDSKRFEMSRSLKLAEARAKGGLDAAKPFLSEESIIREQSLAKEFEIKQSSINDLSEAVQKTQREMLDIVMKRSEQDVAKVAEVLTREDSKTQEYNREFVQAEGSRKISAIGAEQAVTAFEDFRGLNSENFKQIIDNMKDSVRRSDMPKEAKGKELLRLDEVEGKMTVSATEAAVAVDKINKNITLQLELSKIQTSYQQKALAIQKEISSFGGTQDMMGPSGQFGASQNFDKLVAITESTAKGLLINGNASKIELGKMSAQFAEFALTSANLSRTPQNLESLGPIIASAIQGRTLDIQKQFDEFVSVFKILNPAAKLPEINARDLAIKQVSSQLKLENLPQDVSDLLVEAKVANALALTYEEQMKRAGKESYDKLAQATVDAANNINTNNATNSSLLKSALANRLDSIAKILAETRDQQKSKEKIKEFMSAATTINGGGPSVVQNKIDAANDDINKLKLAEERIREPRVPKKPKNLEEAATQNASKVLKYLPKILTKALLTNIPGGILLAPLAEKYTDASAKREKTEQLAGMSKQISEGEQNLAKLEQELKSSQAIDDIQASLNALSKNGFSYGSISKEMMEYIEERIGIVKGLNPNKTKEMDGLLDALRPFFAVVRKDEGTKGDPDHTPIVLKVPGDPGLNTPGGPVPKDVEAAARKKAVEQQNEINRLIAAATKAMLDTNGSLSTLESRSEALKKSLTLLKINFDAAASLDIDKSLAGIVIKAQDVRVGIEKLIEELSGQDFLKFTSGKSVIRDKISKMSQDVQTKKAEYEKENLNGSFPEIEDRVGKIDSARLLELSQMTQEQLDISEFSALTKLQRDAIIESINARKKLTDAQFFSLEIQSRANVLDATALNEENKFKNDKKLYKKGLISSDDLRKQSAAKVDAKIKNGTYEMGDLGAAVSAQNQYDKKDFQKANHEAVLKAVDQFRNGIGDALSEAIMGTKTLRQAFADMFAKIGADLLKSGMDSGIKAILSAAGNSMTKNSGGIIRGYATGGQVAGGSGTRDDVPAYLSAGEYVVRKAAVNKYGPEFLEKLNRGSVIKRALGGAAEINEKIEYVYDNETRPTVGHYETGNTSLLALHDENNPQAQLAIARENALFQYLLDKKTFDQAQIDAIKQFKKNQKKQAKLALIQAAISVAGAGIAQSGAQTLPATGGPGPVPKGSMAANSGGPVRRFASGGLSGIDDIPALLTGGEYVMRKDAVDSYGEDFFNRLNRGSIKGYADGGMVSDGTQPASSGSPDLAQKKKSSAGGITNNITISVTINNEGGTESKKEEENGQDSENTGKMLSDRIEAKVVEVLLQEKRPGGILYDSSGKGD